MFSKIFIQQKRIVLNASIFGQIYVNVYEALKFTILINAKNLTQVLIEALKFTISVNAKNLTQGLIGEVCMFAFRKGTGTICFR